MRRTMLILIIGAFLLLTSKPLFAVSYAEFGERIQKKDLTTNTFTTLVEGGDDFVPECIAYDDTISYPNDNTLSITGEVLVFPGERPQISIQASIQYTGGGENEFTLDQYQFIGGIKLYVQANPTDENAPTVSSVPVYMNSVGHVSFIGEGITGSAIGQVRDSRSVILGDGRADINTELSEFNDTVATRVNVSSDSWVIMNASGHFQVDATQDGWAELQVVTDPLIWIDPEWEYSDSFTLEISPNAIVPIPPSLWLLGTSLLGLGLLGRRRKMD